MIERVVRRKDNIECEHGCKLDWVCMLGGQLSETDC